MTDEKINPKVTRLRKEAIVELKNLIAHLKVGKYSNAHQSAESLTEKLEELADESGQDSFGLDDLDL